MTKVFTVDIQLSVEVPDFYIGSDVIEELCRTIRQDVDVVDLNIWFVEEQEQE